MRSSCASSQKRFIRTFAEYAYAVSDEASDRAKGTVRSITDYLRLTRLTAGPYPCFFPIEMDLDIPDDVMTHPSLEIIRSMAAESLVLGNVGISGLVLRRLRYLTSFLVGFVLVQYRASCRTRRS
jgi:Delta6-protoilludene synthase